MELKKYIKENWKPVVGGMIAGVCLHEIGYEHLDSLAGVAVAGGLIADYIRDNQFAFKKDYGKKL